MKKKKQKKIQVVQEKIIPQKKPKSEGYFEYIFTRDDIVLAAIIIWAICMFKFRY